MIFSGSAAFRTLLTLDVVEWTRLFQKRADMTWYVFSSKNFHLPANAVNVPGLRTWSRSPFDVVGKIRLFVAVEWSSRLISSQRLDYCFRDIHNRQERLSLPFMNCWRVEISTSEKAFDLILNLLLVKLHANKKNLWRRHVHFRL